MMVQWGLLVSLTACLVLTAHSCHHSGLCSSNEVKPWSGVIDSHEALLDALAARSYKKEIILSVFMPNWVEMMVQQWGSLQRLGMGHLLTLAVPNAAVCQQLLEVEPDIGCGWSELLSVYWPDIPLYQLYVFRHMVAARAVRAGWNVLVIDGDISLVNDPYRYLKHPPFSNQHFIVHQEGGWGLNCGAYYIQNAGPSSPAVYFLTEVVDRALRHWDNKYDWLTQRGFKWECVVWEQQQFNDVFFSMLIGGPVLGWTVLRNCRLPGAAPEVLAQADVADKLLTETLEAVGGGDKRYEMSAHAWWRQAMPSGRGFQAKVAPIRIPRHSWGAPPNFPGLEVGPPRGALANTWMSMLTNASSQAPLWPDPESSEAETSASQAQQEMLMVHHHLMQGPTFLMSAWSRGGRLGRWTNHTLPRHTRHVAPDIDLAARLAHAQATHTIAHQDDHTSASLPSSLSIPPGLEPDSTPVFHSIGHLNGMNLAAAQHMFRTGHLKVPLHLVSQIVKEPGEAGVQGDETLDGHTGSGPPHNGQYVTNAGLAHMTAIPFSPHITKLVLTHFVGLFDWDRHKHARQVTGSGLFYASTEARPIPRLVAYHPSVPLHLAHNITAFQVALRGLAQVGAVLNRTVLWPDIPCAAAWISRSGPQHLLKIPHDAGMEVHAQPYGKLGVQRCFNQRYSQAECVQGGRGLLEAEFSYLVRDSSQPDLYKPSPANTILHLTRKPDATASAIWGSAAAARASGSPARDPPDLLDDLLRVQQADVQAAGTGKEYAPVLYVATPLEVIWQDAAGDVSQERQGYDAFQASCAALGAGWADHFEGPHSFAFPEGQLAARRSS